MKGKTTPFCQKISRYLSSRNFWKMAFQRVIADVRQPGAGVWGPEPFAFEFEKLFHRDTKVHFRNVY